MHSYYRTETEDKNFVEKWYRNPNKMPLFRYQEKCRFYVDEYPEQEELRQNYSAKKLIESIIKENPRTYCEEIETDNFFYERFMRRK